MALVIMKLLILACLRGLSVGRHHHGSVSHALSLSLVVVEDAEEVPSEDAPASGGSCGRRSSCASGEARKRKASPGADNLASADAPEAKPGKRPKSGVSGASADALMEMDPPYLADDDESSDVVVLDGIAVRD